jgi:hypothetical protein
LCLAGDAQGFSALADSVASKRKTVDEGIIVPTDRTVSGGPVKIPIRRILGGFFLAGNFFSPTAVLQ